MRLVLVHECRGWRVEMSTLLRQYIDEMPLSSLLLREMEKSRIGSNVNYNQGRVKEA